MPCSIIELGETLDQYVAERSDFTNTFHKPSFKPVTPTKDLKESTETSKPKWGGETFSHPRGETNLHPRGATNTPRGGLSNTELNKPHIEGQ